MKKQGQKRKNQPIVNKKARHDYEVLDAYEAGIQLTGPEVKSLRLGSASLKEAYVVITDGQVNLLNMHVSPYAYARNEEYDPTRTRKLLMRKAEIEKLRGVSQQKGVTLVPLKVYLKSRRFKVEVGVVRGKKEYEKREKLKKRDIRRETERLVKAKYRG